VSLRITAPNTDASNAIPGGRHLHGVARPENTGPSNVGTDAPQSPGGPRALEAEESLGTVQDRVERESRLIQKKRADEDDGEPQHEVEKDSAPLGVPNSATHAHGFRPRRS
jgi:hypothetical protein